ncbi:hypothetical protein N9R81_05980 [Flavobacteriales bacterium]|nr:hypothetical protein [Flavobacteriales bacterium]
MKKTVLLSGFAAATILLTSCGAEPKQEETTASETPVTEEVSQDDLAAEKADFDFHLLIANMPTPLEEFEDLSMNQGSFDIDLMVPISESNKHTTTAAIALNCGVYMVDLTYQTVYHEQEQMLAYLTAAHDLARKCGASYAFNKVLSSGLEKNIDNKDSLQAIMERGYDAMEEYLSNEGRIETATQLLTGGWIETQHIMMQSLQKMENPTDLLKNHVFEQRNHLASLLKLLGEFKGEAGLEAEHDKLVKLEESFLKIHETEDVSHELLVELANEIQEIRDDIVGM